MHRQTGETMAPQPHVPDVQLNVHCSPRFSQGLAQGECSQNCLHPLRKTLCNTDVPETGYASWNGGTFTPVTQIKLKSCPRG